MRCTTTILWLKTLILSQPCFSRLIVFVGRCLFIYDYFSDGVVATKLHQGHNPAWCGIIAIAMMLPYVALLVVLRTIAVHRLASRTGMPATMCTIVWVMCGIPVLICTDIYLHIMYISQDPDDADVLHYLTLRKMLEVIEGSIQTITQGYLLVRLLNPGQFMPHAGGANVNPWLLGTSVATSAHVIHDATDTLQKYASYQT